MSIHENIKGGIMTAMKAHDETRLSVMRGISTAFTNELVATKRKPTDTLSDEEAEAVITRLSKQRKESISQFNAGGRPELAAAEEKELAILSEFLPEMMGVDEIRKFAEAKIRQLADELGTIDATKKGMLVGALMKDLKGKADGGDVKNVVDSLF
jgi:uncharacterized protein YqeY